MHAQFREDSSGNRSAFDQSQGISGTWGGFSTCTSEGPRGWVWFVEIEDSSRGHLVSGISLAESRTWALKYESISVSPNEFVFTPIEEGQVWDGVALNNRITLSNRSGSCNIQLMRIEGFPAGIAIGD